MMWQVYILKSVQNGKTYVGCTNNLERRLFEHNRGYNIATVKGKPWQIIYAEKFHNQQEAYLREKQIKSYKGGNAFKRLLGLK